MTYPSKVVADTQCQGTTRVEFLGPLGKSKGRLAGSLLLSAKEGACQVNRVIVTISRYFHLLEIMTFVSSSCRYKARLRRSDRDSVIHEIEQQSKLSETSFDMGGGLNMDRCGLTKGKAVCKAGECGREMCVVGEGTTGQEIGMSS